MAQVYPMMLDVSDRQILIVGGGSVAARKAAGVIAAGATKVRVIAPGFPGEFDSAVTKIVKRYEPDDLKGADLIFAATDSATINDQIVRDAQAVGVWVNRADGSDDHPGDFSNPAMFEAGLIAVTVSAGSPALSATIRDQLRRRMDPAWMEMAAAMRELRPFIKANFVEGGRRAEMFRALATAEAFAILTAKGIEGLKVWILAV